MAAAHLADRIFAPRDSVPGRRCELLLDVLRAWGDPITAAEIAELLDWGMWAVRQALDLLQAEGRVGTARRGRYIADPPLGPSLTARRPV